MGRIGRMRKFSGAMPFDEHHHTSYTNHASYSSHSFRWRWKPPDEPATREGSFVRLKRRRLVGDSGTDHRGAMGSPDRTYLGPSAPAEGQVGVVSIGRGDGGPGIGGGPGVPLHHHSRQPGSRKGPSIHRPGRAGKGHLLKGQQRAIHPLSWADGWILAGPPW